VKPQVATARAPFSLQLLADRPELVYAVAEIRWKEWGHAPEPEDLAYWVDVTQREAGRNDLPITFVAVDDHGAIGAVGLGQFDIDERRDRSPWVLGMVVRADRRGQGVGRALMGELEAWAAARGVVQAWVATGPAATFYRTCGWRITEVVQRGSGEPTTVLTKRLV